MENLENSFLTRHSIKPTKEDPESARYKGISEQGEELAKERAVELKKMIDECEENAVVFIGGASDAVRTKSTGEAYGDELKLQFINEESVEVITRKEIESFREEEDKVLNKVVEIIKNNKDKKVVVDFPLFLKELSLVKSGWLTDKGELTPFAAKLLEQNNNDNNKTLRAWFENKGQLEGLEGPKPEEVAKNYIQAISRLGNFSRKQIDGRPVIVGLVGHSWDMDALTTYLANDGKIDNEAFDRISGGEMIKETELTQIKIDEQDDRIIYRGKEYEIK